MNFLHSIFVCSLYTSQISYLNKSRHVCKISLHVHTFFEKVVNVNIGQKINKTTVT